MTTYCEYCITHPEDTLNVTYHDTEYGFPLVDDNLLFERLILEINQAGLSWITILRKADNFRKAYHRFNIAKVAKYGEKDVNRLLGDAGIIRNRLKVNAAIVNAQKILQLQKECGSFRNWLDANHPLTKEEWTKLFKRPSNYSFCKKQEKLVQLCTPLPVWILWRYTKAMHLRTCTSDKTSKAHFWSLAGSY